MHAGGVREASRSPSKEGAFMDTFQAAAEGNEVEVLRVLEANPALLKMEAVCGSKPLAIGCHAWAHGSCEAVGA